MLKFDAIVAEGMLDEDSGDELELYSDFQASDSDSTSEESDNEHTHDTGKGRMCVFFAPAVQN